MPKRKIDAVDREESEESYGHNTEGSESTDDSNQSANSGELPPRMHLKILRFTH